MSEEKIGNKVSDQTSVNKENIKKMSVAIPLENFNLMIPMPGQKSGHCVMKFRTNKKITDINVINYLKQTSRSVRYE